MKIKQLGNGGGFDFDQTNSSFLISDDDETSYLLFDCGYNIMEKFVNDYIDISLIDNVFISHMDEDHVGNLKMLIYWRFFKYGKVTYVYCGRGVREQLEKYLSSLNSQLIGGLPSYGLMYNLSSRVEGDYIDINSSLSLHLIEGFHGSVPSYGAFIINNNLKQSVFISGDTKANYSIESRVLVFEKRYSTIALKFHDFSFWDNVTRNVHACRTDYELEYSKEYRDSTILYHTGDKFNKEWIQC